jgi:hypothetical protein
MATKLLAIKLQTFLGNSKVPVTNALAARAVESLFQTVQQQTRETGRFAHPQLGIFRVVYALRASDRQFLFYLPPISSS